MKAITSKNTVIRIAAKLVRGDYTAKLRHIAETQKSIRAGRLNAMLDDVDEEMRKDAIALREWEDEMGTP